MQKVYINKIEYYLPLKKESNAQILKSAGKNKYDAKKWIDKIGIKTRRIAEKNIFSNDLAIMSAKKIMRSIDPNDIDYLIFCTNTPDFILPTNACILQDKLGLKKNIGAIDVILACSGYIYTLGIAKSLIATKQAKNILLITSDVYSKFIKKNDFKNRILFGDGSTSTLISSRKQKNSFQIDNFIYGTDGSGHKNAIINNFGSRYCNNKKKGGDSLNLDGPEIYKFALKRVPIAINEFLKKNNLKFAKIDHFVFHQANEFITKSLQRILNIPDDKVFNEMHSTGNTSSSSIPIVLSKNFNKLSSKKNVLLIGFGGGLSWGVCLIKRSK